MEHLRRSDVMLPPPQLYAPPRWYKNEAVVVGGSDHPFKHGNANEYGKLKQKRCISPSQIINGQ